MGNSCLPGYYKLAEVNNFDHILPAVFSEDSYGETRVSSQETLLVQRRTKANKNSRIQLQSTSYRSLTSAPEMRSSRGRSTKSRRKPMKNRSRVRSRRVYSFPANDFGAINSLIYHKSPMVLAFLTSEAKLHVKRRNSRNSVNHVCSRCENSSRIDAGDSHYYQQYRSQRSQGSIHSSSPCIKYCRSCKLNAFPCANYCRQCMASNHRYRQSTARISPRRYMNLSD